MTTYTYDARGNQTQQVQTGTGVTTTTNYGYDLANRLTSTNISNNAVIPLSTSATYAYNAQGQRVTRVEDEVITHFYYTGSALLFTTVNEYVLQTQNILDPSGTIVASKRFEGQAATGQDPYAEDYFFYRYDVRGSVTNIVDGEGAVVKSYDYDEFGVTTASGGTFFNEVTFTGSVADASGLLYMNARYYNPTTARFLSQDTYTGSASVPWTQHLYAYCNNNPVNMVDPTGHAPVGPMRKNMVCINDGGSGEKETRNSYIIYTQYGSWIGQLLFGESVGKFARQANYYASMEEENGASVTMVQTNTVGEFIDAWNNLPDQADSIYIFSHGNGMSLIFENGKGISATGFDRNDQRIHAIGELDRKQIGSLYLMSCNSGHTDLFDAAGINAAAAFAEMGTIGNVYAYDGSVSFGTPIIRVFSGNYSARLSNNQDSYPAVYTNFGINMPAGSPKGLFRYYWDGITVRYEKEG